MYKTTEQYGKETGRKTPNVYWHDLHNHVYGTLTLIWYGITPKGKTSRHFHQAIIYQRGAFLKLTEAELYEEIVKRDPITEKYRLPKRYQWSEPLIQHNFLRFNPLV